MRVTGIHLQRCALHELGRQQRRRGDGDDLVIVAVKNKSGHVELLEIFGEVGFGESFDAILARLHSTHHSLEPPLIANAF